MRVLVHLVRYRVDRFFTLIEEEAETNSLTLFEALSMWFVFSLWGVCKVCPQTTGYGPWPGVIRLTGGIAGAYVVYKCYPRAEDDV